MCNKYLILNILKQYFSLISQMQLFIIILLVTRVLVSLVGDVRINSQFIHINIYLYLTCYQ